MSKISIIGVSGSGKTSFLYSMAKVLRNGVCQGNSFVQIICSKAHQQMKLNEGYMKLVRRQWPQTSDKSETFDFKVNMQCNGHFSEVIPSLEIQDYSGSILQDSSAAGENDFSSLLDSFRGSSAIIFILDSQTIIDALNPEERDASHRCNNDAFKQFSARAQIELMENIFIEYKRFEEDIPPILIAISKGDIFASDYEKENGIRLIKEKLPSMFATGSKLTTGITIMSLGEDLGSNADGEMIGTLKLNEEYNIHVPAIFGIYADLCYEYAETTDIAERNGISALLLLLRRMFADRVQLFIGGRQAREV